MSDEEQGTSSAETATRMLTAEYKDGQLEIVEVTPYDKHDKIQNLQGHIIEDADGHSGVKYMQVLDGKNVVVDLLNLTLVKCEDGQETYRLVGEEGDDTTVTCVLANDDGDEDGQDNQESYVVIEGDQGEPVVFLQSALQQTNHVKVEAKKEKQSMSPSEILEKAKALQKAKALLTPRTTTTSGSGGRKRRSALPPPHELLASPQFKLFLYSCKLCSFKCNAIKELTAHKAAEHAAGGAGGAGGGAARWRGAGRGAAITLQCARCPYRGATHNQLMKHVKEKHVETMNTTKVYLDSAEAAEADVLVCGACGFEAGEREAFRAHVLSDHSH